MLIDNVTIKVKSGNGGKGAVAFSKTKMTLGPTGASGGRGGDVYLEAVADIGVLRHFRSKKSFAAQNGRDGRSSFRDGRNGEDLVLAVPRGTVVHDLTAKTQFEFSKLGERVLIASGGSGGKGNFHYKSSTNTSPKQSRPGLPGEEHALRLELKLIADVGLIGLPNVGKSSFLNAVTNAQSRVADYAFTTLEPHLGTYYGLVLADIPGLMEGASSGRGLGIKFLRHIERTRLLFHFIDSTTDDAVRDYNIIRKELGEYNPALLRKKGYIFVTKTDLTEKERISEITNDLKARVGEKEIFPISVNNKEQMANSKKLLNKELENR